VRGKRGHAFLRKIHERVKPLQRVLDDLPIALGSRVADAEFDAIRSPRQRAVFAEELRGKFVAIEFVPLLEADLIRPQPEPGRGVANFRAEFFELCLIESERRSEGDIDVNAEDVDWDDFHEAGKIGARRGLATPIFSRA
jgi:hypothetical protein